jgi:hypothetical protein
VKLGWKVSRVDTGTLEEFQLDGDESLVAGVFVGVDNDKLEVGCWLMKSDEFALKSVHGGDGCECVVERPDFREHGHVLFDLAHDLSIVGSFRLEPVP